MLTGQKHVLRPRNVNISFLSTKRRSTKTHKIPVSSNCVAHTPPPLLAKGAPKLAFCCSITPHPPVGLPAVPEQSELTVFPVCFAPGSCVHPSSVWSVIWFAVARLTCSTMSISPPLGQTAAFVQNPGQTEHPYGTCRASKRKTEPRR